MSDTKSLTKRFYIATIVFFVTNIKLLIASENKDPSFQIIFIKGKMVILDTVNEKTYNGNRKNVEALLKDDSFNKALIRDLKIEPRVFKTKFLKNKGIGLGRSITKGLVNLMKDQEKFIKGQFIRFKNAEHFKKLKNNLPSNPTCRDIMSVLVADQLIHDDDSEINPDSDKINKYIESKEEEIGLLDSTSNIIHFIENINEPIINPCQKISIPEELEPITCIQSEKFVYNKPEGYKQNKEKQRETAREVLSSYESSLSEGRSSEGEISNELIKLKISLIKSYQRMDAEGCYAPYARLEEDVLKDEEKLPNELPCDYSKGKDKLGLIFGEKCYPQRYSCMDKKQTAKFNKLNQDGKFINEDPNKDENTVKFFIKEKGTPNIRSSYTNDYEYTKGNDYDIKGMNEEQENYNLVKEARLLASDIKQAVVKNPKYYIDSNKDRNIPFVNVDINNLKEISSKLAKVYQNPRYPHFRPTDQCSVPMQGGGGVCFQEACKQHDICFQTIPNVDGENMAERFDRCNNTFQDNIGTLCNANAKKGIWGGIKKARCHAAKKVFYLGVVHIETALKGKKGYSFYKSQKDAYIYKKELYRLLNNRHCKNKSSEICKQIADARINLDLIGLKYNLSEDNSKK